ncbi:MAG: glycine--tRNA ligase [Bdellovibrionales bacterium]|nr:glycine--tRNA ligase [Bdellovibrionales bacterium]
MSQKMMENLVSLCKRRGFIYPSSEIYGGLNSCYDYGPLGVELKRNLKNFWWKSMVQLHDNIEGLDSSILMHPKIWEASGHVANFTDPLVDCKKCKNRFRQDHLEGTVCPNCKGELTEARQFNLMFKTFMGPVESEASVVYLRPETAQGIYVNYQNVLGTSRQKIPFGIAQIGKAFRNEITPGNFIFRTREFEQMEMQYFVKPGEDMTAFDEWKEKRVAWYTKIGISKDKIRLHEHGPDELAHYAKKAFDIQYEFPFGWQELEGIHHRSDFDLNQHQKFSGKNLQYFDEGLKEKYIPYIIETSAGCDRSLLCILCDAYTEEEERVVMKFSPQMAPVQVAVLPLVKKDGLGKLAKAIAENLQNKFSVFYDESGSIGRRYRRQDEIGTPYCVTFDYDTKTNHTVTVRNRDTMNQDRVGTDQLSEFLIKHLSMNP